MTSNNNSNKKLILNAFEMGAIGHQNPGLWTHPRDTKTDGYKSIEYWTNLAKLLERGKFNAVFIADVLGGYDVYNGPGNLDAAIASAAQWPVNEPSAVVSAMAAVTKNLSFGLTFSTISEAPYHFARRLATLDHLTNGRVGWNIVSSYLDSASRNLLNGEPLLEHDERYVRASEYLDVVYDLFLSSWRDDAVVKDKERGVYAEPDRLRRINHKGKYFTVPGPGMTEPTPQRLPVILQAGASKKGTAFAARNAEVVFISSPTPVSLKAQIDSTKKLAKEEFGRDEGTIKFLQLITVIIGKTREDAEDKYRDYLKHGDLEGAQALFSGWTGIDIGKYGKDEELTEVESNAIRSSAQNWTKPAPGAPANLKRTREFLASKIVVGGLGPVILGTATEVADEIENWVNVSGVDGFNFCYSVTPGSFEDIVDYLVPELQSRGLFWDDYPESNDEKDSNLSFREQIFGTTRDDPKFLLPSHPAHKLRWTSEYSREEFDKYLEKINSS
ncbi:Nitrilotriacetate monooxygenase component A/pristinamycin IIA synthase subunit A [Suhomyces tanzawaensis NRRL Y-17324]|uniref:Nitrilotriacetate monooxygenase component A/pristinamycin IIA synthase subunit A n=1 Tax=Suhomyces tanzawaensis NRRL Y-17324 TaxID=984487 RepID=A0A1E4SRU7_9ASCO|nr:Nitrilotriacetate monooxygenase component A/pristinamycin IIA synthase subunit A [Suhomyces tanzawaensis NRRL Y-17324]ODV82147.1 Nitrilotriacetate monooxygenase component A/pristinamycin IIA synthase subunit A [Suhomyces tanzawaensis NRRL Y-17324]